MLKIDALLNGIQVKAGETGEKVKGASMTAQQFTRILYRMNHLLVHMGLGADVNGAISKLQRLVFVARMAQMSLSFASMAPPYGLIMGVMGMTSVAIGAGELTSDIREEMQGHG